MLKKFTINKILFLIILSSNLLANDANKFVQAYPNFIKEVSNNHLIWNDNEKMIFDDKIENKNFKEKLNNPSLKNQLDIPYIKLSENKDYIPSKNEDAGRIRYEPFFKKMYGSNQKEVKQNLVKIIWLPKSSKKVLWVSKVII